MRNLIIEMLLLNITIMKQLYYTFLILLISLCAFEIDAQELKKEVKQENKPKIEIRSNSRKQMAVMRDNQHQRRDLRFIKMNKKMRMSRQKMKAYYKQHLQNKANRNKVIKRKAPDVNMQKKKMMQRKRAQKQKQQINRKRTR
jgi:hypothetical protein